MPRFEKGRALNSKPAATSTLERENTAEETNQGETETSPFFTPSQLNLVKNPRVTPNNILSMQRTIGNKAVQRLIQQQKAPVTHPAAHPWQPQPTMTHAKRPVDRNSVQTHSSIPAASVPASFTLQRLSTSANIIKQADDGATGTKFNHLLNLVDAYHTITRKENKKVGASLPERQQQANDLTEALNKIDAQTKIYLENHANKKSTYLNNDRIKTVATVKRLQLEVGLEKADLTRVVNNGIYDNTNDATKVTWETALATLQNHIDDGGFSKNQRIAKIVNSLGFPVEYVKTLTLAQIILIFDANLALAEGQLGPADQALSDLKAALPDTFTLINSTLMRKNIGKINPDLAELITDDKYTQKKGKSADASMKAMKGNDARHFNTYTENFTDNMNRPEDDVNKFAAGKNHNPELAADIKARQAWEKKNVKLKDFTKLKDHEKTAISQYSQDYKQFNDPLRADLTSGEGEKKFNQEKLEKTRSLVSALNSLPPYEGLVYRHDTDFPGFKELNQVGGIVSDMSFTSSSREAYSLKKIENPPDILNVIQSKTGRFIKPGSYYSNSLAEDENEVLFKPGTQFKVVKRYEIDQHGQFPVDMDPELLKALNKDIEKATIKMILKKEEV